MIPEWFAVICVFFFGLLLGSFLNVCIWRIPRGESIVFPQSHCTRCGVILKPADLIPVLSCLVYRFRCRYCAGRISVRYSLVEILTAVIFTGLFLKHGFTLNTVIYIAVAAACVVMAFIDFDLQIIPDSITLPGIVAGFFLNVVLTVFIASDIRYQMHYSVDLFDSFYGILAGGGALYIIAYFGGMGGGDVKLAAMLGAFFGVKFIAVALVLSFLIGSLVGVGSIIFRKTGASDYIAFGPSIVAGALITMYLGVDYLQAAFYGYLRSGI